MIWGEAEGLLDIYRGHPCRRRRRTGRRDRWPPTRSRHLRRTRAAARRRRVRRRRGQFRGRRRKEERQGHGHPVRHPRNRGSPGPCQPHRGSRDLRVQRDAARPASRTDPGTLVLPWIQPLDTPTPIDQVPAPSIVEQKNGRGSTTTSSTSTTVVGRSSTTVPPVSTPTSVDSVTTTSTLNQDVTTTTAIGVNTFDAKAVVASGS